MFTIERCLPHPLCEAEFLVVDEVRRLLPGATVEFQTMISPTMLFDVGVMRVRKGTKILEISLALDGLAHADDFGAGMIDLILKTFRDAVVHLLFPTFRIGRAAPRHLKPAILDRPEAKPWRKFRCSRFFC
jgi:hypothetical protein